MSKVKQFSLIIFSVFLLALIIEAFNFFVTKWWIFKNTLAFVNTLILWMILGTILGLLRVIGKIKIIGPAFAVWGVFIETVNLNYLQFWEFTSELAMIGTYFGWIFLGLAFSFLVYFTKLFHRLEKWLGIELI